MKNGVVQDKLWLPGLLKLEAAPATPASSAESSPSAASSATGSSRAIRSPAQRPSWNYRKEDGGGIIIDMLCHFRYVLDNLFGDVQAVSCLGATHVGRALGRKRRSPTTAPPTTPPTRHSSLDGGIVAHINASWCVRVRRDDLLVLQVDGTQGQRRGRPARLLGAALRRHAAAGVESRRRQSRSITSTAGSEFPSSSDYDNAFKIQWELFLRHVVKRRAVPLDASGRRQGRATWPKKGLESWRRQWVAVEDTSGRTPPACLAGERVWTARNGGRSMKRIALVTGGTRGIGLGIARCLAREGFDLAVCGRREPTAVAGVARKPCAAQARSLVCPGRRRRCRQPGGRLIDAVRARYGRLHVLVNNAGVAPKSGPTSWKPRRREFRSRAAERTCKGRTFSRRPRANWMIAQKRSEAAFRGCDRQHLLDLRHSGLVQPRRILHLQGGRGHGHEALGRAVGRIRHSRLRSSPRHHPDRHDRRRPGQVRQALGRRAGPAAPLGHRRGRGQARWRRSPAAISPTRPARSSWSTAGSCRGCEHSLRAQAGAPSGFIGRAFRRSFHYRRYILRVAQIQGRKPLLLARHWGAAKTDETVRR